MKLFGEGGGGVKDKDEDVISPEGWKKLKLVGRQMIFCLPSRIMKKQCEVKMFVVLLSNDNHMTNFYFVRRNKV